MKHHTGNWIAMLALTGVLSACGGGGTSEAGNGGGAKDDNPQPVQLSEYAGVVADENGLPVAGISVRLEDRTTDEVTEVVTTADGSFSAAVEPGVYDIIFDDPDAEEYVSVQKTAVDLRLPEAAPAPTPAPVQVRLPAARPLASNLLQGTASYTDGKPAAHRKLLIEPVIARARPAQAPADVPDPVVVETDARGTFSHPLGTPGTHLDFDVKILAADAPRLDMEPLAFNHQFATTQEQAAAVEEVKNFIAAYAQESINIHKPDGPMQLELTLGSPVHNLRSASGTANGIPEDEKRLAIHSGEQASQPSPPATPPAGAGKNQFHLAREQVMEDGNPRLGKFFAGRLEISKTCDHRSFKDITAPASGIFDTEYSRNTSLCATETQWSRPLFTHELRLKTHLKSKYKFTDASGDTYALTVLTQTPDKVHVVRYRSKAPDIVGIAFELPPPLLD